jgi:hypothetical protein
MREKRAEKWSVQYSPTSAAPAAAAAASNINPSKAAAAAAAATVARSYGNKHCRCED